MASSSRKPNNQNLGNPSNVPFEEQQKEEEEVLKEAAHDDHDWLKLGLGLGPNYKAAWRNSNSQEEHVCEYSNPVVSSSSSTFHGYFEDNNQVQMMGLGLGLEIGVSGQSGLGQYHHHNRNFVEEEAAYDLHYKKYSYGDRLMQLQSCSGFHHLRDWQMPVLHSTVPPDYEQSHRRRTSFHYQSGLWFTLCSSINRNGEALPQIPKAYIRVKDESVTVFVVKKYLVTKLGLSNEAEIEITCMGQNLVHTETLKQVRDEVWLPRFIRSSLNSTPILFDAEFDESSVNYLMRLHYGKRCVVGLN